MREFDYIKAPENGVGRIGEHGEENKCRNY